MAHTGFNGSVNKDTLYAFGTWGVRHLSTIILIFGLLWFLGEPRLQDYISSTVAGQFSEQTVILDDVQNRLRGQERATTANTRELHQVKKAVEALTRASTSNAEINSEILDIVRNVFPAPAPGIRQ